jgi:hypothetical protein
MLRFLFAMCSRLERVIVPGTQRTLHDDPIQWLLLRHPSLAEPKLESRSQVTSSFYSLRELALGRSSPPTSLSVVISLVKLPKLEVLHVDSVGEWTDPETTAFSTNDIGDAIRQRTGLEHLLLDTTELYTRFNTPPARGFGSFASLVHLRTLFVDTWSITRTGLTDISPPTLQELYLLSDRGRRLESYEVDWLAAQAQVREVLPALQKLVRVPRRYKTYVVGAGRIQRHYLDYDSIGGFPPKFTPIERRSYSAIRETGSLSQETEHDDHPGTEIYTAKSRTTPTVCQMRLMPRRVIPDRRPLDP